MSWAWCLIPYLLSSAHGSPSASSPSILVSGDRTELQSAPACRLSLGGPLVSESKQAAMYKIPIIPAGERVTLHLRCHIQACAYLSLQPFVSLPLNIPGVCSMYLSLSSNAVGFTRGPCLAYGLMGRLQSVSTPTMAVDVDTSCLSHSQSLYPAQAPLWPPCDST